MPTFRATDEQISRFHADGYFAVDRFFTDEETDLLRKIARADHQLEQQAASRGDGEGGAIKLVVSNDVDDDIYGAIVRSRRVVDTMEKMLGGEVYHYHHKMILKEPFVGGAWAWHQDYGYWYNNGCLFPLLASCMIAVDKATLANGCLQVLKGSHLMGRIDHGKVGDQTGADLERVHVALERLELAYWEAEPGSALFFHSNLLHRSDQNKSPDPRWAFICCYNAARNNPYKESRHPQYSKLEKWDDSRIAEVGRKQWQEMQSSLSAAASS
ncbi:MAG: phytanoyl-CoA dioxygenase family protein [Planctomycetales bacterium]|nr:phytanoyl-CoA dioxygenase family protein [Planctomycetales bacterium]